MKYKVTALLLLWSVLLIVVVLVAKSFMADVYFKKSEKALDNTQVETAIKYSDLALKLNPKEPNYYRGRAKIYLVALVLAEENEKTTIKETAAEYLRKGLSLNPNNLVTIRNEVPIYYLLALSDLTAYGELGREPGIDEKFAPVARDFMENAKKEYSHDAGVLALVAQYEKKLGFAREYEESVEMVKSLRPDLVEWHSSFKAD